MNERIKELAIKAGLLSADYNGFDSNRLTKSEVNFAELIVRECAELVKDFYQDDEFCYSAKTEIKEHFGVEE